MDGQGVVDLSWLAARLQRAGRRAGSGLGPGGKQRDRRDPAGRRGGGAGASLSRAPARRRGPGRRENPLRHQGARGGCSDAVGAQARRPEGRRRDRHGLGRGSRSATVSSAAAGRSAATGPAPRTSPGSSASASRPSLPGAIATAFPPVPRPLFSQSRPVLPPIQSTRWYSAAQTPPASEHPGLRDPRHPRRDGADPVRPRGRRGLVRLRLLLRQGPALACPRGDGRAAGARRRRHPGELRLEFDARRMPIASFRRAKSSSRPYMSGGRRRPERPRSPSRVSSTRGP